MDGKNDSTNYFIRRAALSWKDESAFNGKDVIDGYAEPEICNHLSAIPNIDIEIHLRTIGW